MSFPLKILVISRYEDYCDIALNSRLDSRLFIWAFIQPITSFTFGSLSEWELDISIIRLIWTTNRCDYPLAQLLRQISGSVDGPNTWILITKQIITEVHRHSNVILWIPKHNIRPNIRCIIRNKSITKHTHTTHRTNFGLLVASYGSTFGVQLEEQEYDRSGNG